MPGDFNSDSLGVDDPAHIANLDGSGWAPIRELGRGGGGIVLLCARQTTIDALDGYARAAGALSAWPSSSRDDIRSRLEQVLGSARDPDGFAAVKLPRLDESTRPGEEERFRREVDATEQYVHPALIRFIDRDRRNPPRWFAMEYHRRGTLAEPENRAKYLGEPLSVLSAIRPVAEALRLVHHGGAVHRDVKPRNIFVGDGSQLVLGDFGIVVPAPEATRLTAIEPAHSRDWVPDWVQFGEERRYTAAVDVFALAKVMYYLLAGENVMASQLYREVDTLRAKFADARAIVPMLTLLEKCIVDREDKCVITDGAGLVKEVDAILASEAAQSPKQMLFSWLSTHPTTDIESAHVPGEQRRTPPDLWPSLPRLSGVQVFLGRSTERVVGRARLRGGGDGMIQVGVGTATSGPTGLPASARTNEDSWTDEFVVRASSPLAPGWHELVVRASTEGVGLSGLLLYAA